MDALQLRARMIAEDLSVREGSMAQRLLAMERVLRMAIPPKTASDRTCYRNVIAWLRRKFDSDRFNPDEILPRCVDYALEASGPTIRNPRALFMSLLKKELGYPK